MKLKGKLIWVKLESDRARCGHRAGRIAKVQRLKSGKIRSITIRLHDGFGFNGTKVKLRPSEMLNAEGVVYRGKCRPIAEEVAA